MDRLTRLPGTLSFVATLWLGAVLAGSGAPVSRPNILFIMSDDHAAQAVSAYGSGLNRTPQIDRIGATGMRFAHCFAANSICTPSRATILTGKYSHLNGVTVFNRFDGAQPHVGKYLQASGYQTAVIGKWHLFSDPTGFDYWNVLPGQGRYVDPVMIEMGRTNVVKGYATDVITDLSLDWLKRRDPARPFFLCLHHKAPHREWTPDAKHAQMYEDRDLPRPVTFDDDYRTRSRAAAEATMRIERDFKKTDVKAVPPADLSGAALKNWNYQRYIKDYLRCIASVDDNVGRVLDYLEQTGLRTNTLVIYTSDQGFFLGEHGWYDKRFMYEESLRMPFLVSWPGQIKPGRVNEDMVLNVDFAPTFMELAGVGVPAEIQGRSIVPLWQGRRPRDWRTSMYYRYYHYPADHRVQPHYGVRTERHKLIYFNRLDEWELFDLKKDPYETNNVYDSRAYASTVKKLTLELARLRTELNDTNQWADRPPDAVPLKNPPLQLAWRLNSAQGADPDGKDPANAPVVMPGRTGKALRFLGAATTPVRTPIGNLNPAEKTLAAGAWCRPENSNGVVLALGGPAQGFTLYLKDGVPMFSVRSRGDLFTVQGPVRLPTNEWVHLVGALRSRDELALLVNGAEAALFGGAAIASKPADGLSVGADAGGLVGGYTNSLPWRGLIEDARIYWGELTPDELRRWRDGR